MSSFVYPFPRYGSARIPERGAAVKLWTRQILALPEEAVVSVSEFGCAKPTCPNKLTTILVMREGAPTRKVTIHKSIPDVEESDVRDACSDLVGHPAS